MKRKLVYLINPISGSFRKSNLKAVIIQKTQAAGFPFEIMDTRIDGNYRSLYDKIVDENITDVIICGGDGSVSLVAAALLKTTVAIGIGQWPCTCGRYSGINKTIPGHYIQGPFSTGGWFYHQR